MKLSLAVAVAALVTLVSLAFPYMTGSEPLPWQCDELGRYSVMADGPSQYPLPKNATVDPGSGVFVRGVVNGPAGGCYVGVLSYSAADDWHKPGDYAMLSSKSGAFDLRAWSAGGVTPPAERLVKVVVGDTNCATLIYATSGNGGFRGPVPDVCREVASWPVRVAAI